MSQIDVEHSSDINNRQFVQEGLIGFYRDDVLQAENIQELEPHHRSAICEGLVIPPYKGYVYLTEEQEKKHFSSNKIHTIVMAAEQRQNSAANRKMQRLISSRRDYKSTVIDLTKEDEATTSVSASKRGVTEYPFIDLRTKIGQVKKRPAATHPVGKIGGSKKSKTDHNPSDTSGMSLLLNPC